MKDKPIEDFDSGAEDGLDLGTYSPPTVQIVRRSRIASLIFNAEIRPGEKMNIYVVPQMIFRPHRLVYKGPKDTFRLCDFVIGHRREFFTQQTSTGISMDFFSPGEKEEAMYEMYIKKSDPPSTYSLKAILHNLGNCQMCPPAIHILLTVENVLPKTPGCAPMHFEAVMYGEAID